MDKAIQAVGPIYDVYEMRTYVLPIQCHRARLKPYHQREQSSMDKEWSYGEISYLRLRVCPILLNSLANVSLAKTNEVWTRRFKQFGESMTSMK